MIRTVAPFNVALFSLRVLANIPFAYIEDYFLNPL